MKKIKTLCYILVAMFMLSSCATYNAPTKYQGKNLYKFSNKKKTYRAGKFRSHKIIAFKKRGSYWHGAVPAPVRKELRQRWWQEKSGGGQLYK